VIACTRPSLAACQSDDSFNHDYWGGARRIGLTEPEAPDLSSLLLIFPGLIGAVRRTPLIARERRPGRSVSPGPGLGLLRWAIRQDVLLAAVLTAPRGLSERAFNLYSQPFLAMARSAATAAGVRRPARSSSAAGPWPRLHLCLRRRGDRRTVPRWRRRSLDLLPPWPPRSLPCAALHAPRTIGVSQAHAPPRLGAGQLLQPARRRQLACNYLIPHAAAAAPPKSEIVGSDPLVLADTPLPHLVSYIRRPVAGTSKLSRAAGLAGPVPRDLIAAHLLAGPPASRMRRGAGGHFAGRPSGR